LKPFGQCSGSLGIKDIRYGDLKPFGQCSGSLGIKDIRYGDLKPFGQCSGSLGIKDIRYGDLDFKPFGQDCVNVSAMTSDTYLYQEHVFTLTRIWVQLG
jgi:hypothetical protein